MVLLKIILINEMLKLKSQILTMNISSTITYMGILRRGNKRKSGVKSILANPNFTLLQDDMVVDIKTGRLWKICD